MWNRAVLLILLSWTLLAQTSRVPFVGCVTLGQIERLEAPKGVDETVRIDTSAAKRLAYYKGEVSSGILAPRGWHCLGLWGSSGPRLYVLRDPMDEQSFPLSGGITGPAIEVDDVTAESSGRYEVAQVIARVFPAHWAFAKSIIDGLDDGTYYKFGPFQKDRLIVQTDRLVRYRTPANSEGLGTMSLWKANEDPVDGVAMLQGPTPDLLMLRVRLPRNLRDLAPVIIQQLLLRQRRDAR